MDGRSDQLSNQTRICRDPEQQPRQQQFYPTALFFARRPRNWQPSVSVHQQPAPRHFSHSAKRPPNTMMFFFHLFLSLLLPLLFFCLGPGYCCCRRCCCCCFGLFTSFSCFLFRGLRSQPTSTSQVSHPSQRVLSLRSICAPLTGPWFLLTDISTRD